jgi:hypothetical protein
MYFLFIQQPQPQQLLCQVVYVIPGTIATDADRNHHNENLLAFHRIDDAVTLADCPDAAKTGQLSEHRLALFFRRLDRTVDDRDDLFPDAAVCYRSQHTHGRGGNGDPSTHNASSRFASSQGMASPMSISSMFFLSSDVNYFGASIIGNVLLMASSHTVKVQVFLLVSRLY